LNVLILKALADNYNRIYNTQVITEYQMQKAESEALDLPFSSESHFLFSENEKIESVLLKTVATFVKLHHLED